jgi:hypothetical protein
MFIFPSSVNDAGGKHVRSVVFGASRMPLRAARIWCRARGGARPCDLAKVGDAAFAPCVASGPIRGAPLPHVHARGERCSRSCVEALARSIFALAPARAPAAKTTRSQRGCRGRPPFWSTRERVADRASERDTTNVKNFLLFALPRGTHSLSMRPSVGLRRFDLRLLPMTSARFATCASH